MRLSEWMNKNQFTAARMAKAIGITAPAMSGYVTGKTLPSLLNAIKIEDVTKGEVTCRDLVPVQAEEIDSL